MSNVQFDANSGCWLWQAGLTLQGYAKVRHLGKTHVAHRVMWSFDHGPIPAGMFVYHTCDTRLCVNPAHLWIGTVKDNNLDARRKGRNAFGSKNGQSKLTEDQIRKIRVLGTMWKQGRIAKAYGVDRTSVGKILRGEAWKHV